MARAVGQRPARGAAGVGRVMHGAQGAQAGADGGGARARPLNGSGRAAALLKPTSPDPNVWTAVLGLGRRTIFHTSLCLMGKMHFRSVLGCRIGSFASAARDSAVAVRDARSCSASSFCLRWAFSWRAWARLVIVCVGAGVLEVVETSAGRKSQRG